MNDEEDFFPDRKKNKKERKILQKKDRSKFKITDLSKKKEKTFDLSLQQGKICTVFSEKALVYSNQTAYYCSLKGLLKKERSKKKNIVIVGDNVLFEKGVENEGVIQHVLERKTLLSRKAKHTQQEQLIAANIDQVLITCTISSPPLDIRYLDRSIIACYKGKMQPIILINKTDLEAPPEEFCQLYQGLNVPIICTSTVTKKGLQELEKILINKTSVFVGLSGVGKSSLLNVLFDLDLPSNELAKKINRGRHTTTHSSLIPLALGGFCIDTPGIQNFGIWALEKNDIHHFFHEIVKNSHLCHYANCTHEHEPNCWIQHLVKEGVIPSFHLDSYHLLLNELQK